MSKKQKILLVLISIIVVIGLICGILTTVRYVTLKNLYKKVATLVEYDNYHFKTTLKNSEGTTVTEAFYKDGTGKLLAENGIYTWVNSNRAYMVNEEEETAYILSTDNNNLLVSYDMFASIIPGYKSNFFRRLFLAGNMANEIKTIKEDGRKFILIKVNEAKAVKTVWVDQNTGKPVKATVKFSNGEIWEYEYELEFNTLKRKDTALPDLMQYTLIDPSQENNK